MNRQELERYLMASRGHSVVVDVQESGQTPGVLRVIRIYRDMSVSIEFERAKSYVDCDIEGGIIKYIAEYENLDVIVADLEEYLNMPLNGWRNYTAQPYTPSILDEPDHEANQEYFENLIRCNAMSLPRRGKYRLTSSYWRHIAKYGEYREDMLFEEQDEEFGLDEQEE